MRRRGATGVWEIFLPGIGEEHFHAFLGVPIIHHRRVLGVLVVQQGESSRCFDEGEEAFLVTVSAQLAVAPLLPATILVVVVLMEYV